MDVLILHSTDTSPLDNSDKGQANMFAEQRDALRGWVAFGGHLIICGGPNAIPTAAGLGDLLPVQINGTLTTADVGTLGDFAGTPFLVNVPAVIPDVSVAIPDVSVAIPDVSVAISDVSVAISDVADKVRLSVVIAQVEPTTGNGLPPAVLVGHFWPNQRLRT